MNWPSKVLMVTPDFFNVEYAINPHMVDAQGQLHQVDQTLAQKQWQNLKDIFAKLGQQVVVMPGQEKLPDMVFCANQTFPFLKNNRLNLILSQMHSEQRQPEVAFFKTWAKENSIETHETLSSHFEGMGDALWNYETGEVFGGYGFRTSPQVYADIEKIIEQKVITLELKNPNFYHLDTCLAILNENTAAFVKEAFTEEGLQTLGRHFDRLLEVPLEEAMQQLACNMCTPNGQDVIIQAGAEKTNKLLQRQGFKVHETDTSEFIKSGGSVFCMKMLLF